jgi:hypothetical protein
MRDDTRPAACPGGRHCGSSSILRPYHVPYDELLPNRVLRLWEVHEWRHASAVLATDFPEQWEDLLYVLDNFRLFRSEVERPGGRRSRISVRIDSLFWQRGWRPKAFDTAVRIDDVEKLSPTHEVDNWKSGVAVDTEWNNKDPFYDRDLNNFRLLFELRALSVGVIITRTSELQQIFKELGRGKSYGASTTHMRKLLPRLEGGSGGGCPVMVFGIKPGLYVDDVARPRRFVPLPDIDEEGRRALGAVADEEAEDE